MQVFHRTCLERSKSNVPERRKKGMKKQKQQFLHIRIDKKLMKIIDGK